MQQDFQSHNKTVCQKRRLIRAENWPGMFLRIKMNIRRDDNKLDHLGILTYIAIKIFGYLHASG